MSYALHSASFWEMWRPDILFLTGVWAIIYFAVIGPLRARFVLSEPVSISQRACFLTGLVVYYLASGSPLNYIGHHYLFSVHMFKQSLMYMIVPPLLLLGTPRWLLRAVFRQEWVRKVFYIGSQPLLAALMFNVLFSFYHVPSVFEVVMNQPFVSVVYHSVLFLAALQMWWTIVNPVPELRNVSELLRMGFIVANGVLLTPACALIIFADVTLYSHYASSPKLVDFLTPLDDQQLGGIVMKLIQEVAFLIAFAMIFIQWYKRENSSSPIHSEGSTRNSPDESC